MEIASIRSPCEKSEYSRIFLVNGTAFLPSQLVLQMSPNETFSTDNAVSSNAKAIIPAMNSAEDLPNGNFIPCATAQHNRVMWKIDLHILPWLAIFFFLSFLDRVNIGNARLFGLESDLHMSGSDFNIALLVFFAPYILFEIPSNLVLRKITPRIWLPSTLYLLLLLGLMT